MHLSQKNKDDGKKKQKSKRISWNENKESKMKKKKHVFNSTDFALFLHLHFAVFFTHSPHYLLHSLAHPLSLLFLFSRLLALNFSGSNFGDKPKYFTKQLDRTNPRARLPKEITHIFIFVKKSHLIKLALLSVSLSVCLLFTARRRHSRCYSMRAAYDYFTFRVLFLIHSFHCISNVIIILQ